ncbi:MAG: carbohydrate binding domain-containing protein [Verrucomicrobia bacterium]|nr:carbohydrate binding domain-containing protein [Verrucomicrobiota bacterium]
MPVTESYASYSGYIQITNNNVDHVKVYIYSTDWKNYAGYSREAGLMAVAHCFNGPYGYDESTSTFVYTNKITGLAESACVSKYTFMKEEMHTPGGRLYDVWGGLQWPLVVKGANISYDPDTGQIKIIVRNVSAETSLSAPVHVFARNKNAGPAWDTSMYIKAKPENIQNSLILASRIAYNPGDYAVPGPTATTDDPLTSGDNALELTFTPSNTVSNGQRIYVYIEDTPTVKGWTAFNDLPECFLSITERDEYLEITAQAADENGISKIELEYSLDGGTNWDALKSANADYLTATFDRTVSAVAFRARALDAYNLSSRWVYSSWSAAQVYVNNNSSVTAETGAANAPFKSIQSAINMAGPETQIFVAKGIYRENLLFKDDIKIRGEAADLVIIASEADFAALVSSADNVLIENIAFNGINGIKLDAANNLRMRNCIFDVENTAIEMTGNASALVENITIGAADQAILAGDGSSLEISHSIITASDGIVCSGGAQCDSSYNNVFCVNQNYIGTSAGTGDISVNPLYSDNDIADYYALKERSSCWTAGYRQLSIGWQRINLVENFGFELGTEGWASAYSANPSTLCTSTASFAGNYALKATTPGISLFEGLRTAAGCFVEQGKTYTASAYVKGAGQVKICLYSVAGGWTYAQNVTTLNSDWKKISVTRTITEPYEVLGVHILTWDTAQAVTFYADNVELVENQNYKMFYNGSFELGTKGWTFYCNDNSTTFETSGASLAEDYALKVTTLGLGVFEGLKTVAGYVVEQGKTYTASAYVKGQGRVKICLYSSGVWTYAKNVTALNSGWQKISVTRTITQTNEALRVYIITWDTAQAVTFYADDIQLKEENLVGYWQFDEENPAMAKDSSWRGNHGVLYGSPQWSGDAFIFDGVDDYIDCGTNASLQVSQITMEAWVYSPTTNFTGWQEVACAEGAYGLDISNNRMYPHINTVNQGWHWCQYSERLSWNGWHHVAFTYDGVNTVKCYRDGELIFTDATSSSGPLRSDWLHGLYIGKVSMGFFKGSIDDVKVFNRALSDYEIRSHFREREENINLVGDWQFDEGTNASMATDSSWEGNNGVLYGSPQWSDGAFVFDGIDDYIDCGTNASLKVSEITMEAWVYSPTTNFSGWNEVACAEGTYGLDISNNRMYPHINTVNQGWHWCQYSAPLSWDGWRHVAFTYDGLNTTKCYRDGELIFTDVTSSSGPLQSDWLHGLYIGKVSMGLFKGSIDDVKVFNRALTDYEIRSHFKKGRKY